MTCFPTSCRCACHGLLLSAALGLAGCVSLSGEAPQVDPALPASYAGHANPGPARTAAELAWQNHFRAPDLQALIAQALRNNHDLRAAVLRVQETQAAYRIQRSAAVPGLGLAADAARERVPADRSATGHAGAANQFRAGIGLSSWEIDLWGRIASLNEAALQEFLATRAAERAIGLSLIAQVADGWLHLQELDARVQLAQAAEDNQRASLLLTTRRFEVGNATRLELTQAQALLLDTQGQTLALRQQRELQRHALNLLAGTTDALPAAQDHSGAAGAPEVQSIAPLPAGLPSELLVHRPDIVAAEHQLRAAHARIGAARAAFFPRIGLTAFGGLASSALNDLFKGASRAWNFAPSLSLPIFDGGLNRANLTLAQVRQQQAVVAYQQAIQTAFREVADALTSQHGLQQQLGVQQQALDVQQERSRLAQASHAHGKAPYLEVLLAERERLQAEQAVVQARHALLRSRVALYVAVGGGSQAWIDSSSVPEHSGQ